MEIDKYVDKIKAVTLYEARNAENLPADILKEWPTNMRYSDKMARLLSSSAKMSSTFRGDFALKLDGLLDGIDTKFGGVDGWRITKAIEAEGERASREAEEKQGFLGKVGL